jgi:hypothetical protein
VAIGGVNFGMERGEEKTPTTIYRESQRREGKKAANEREELFRQTFFFESFPLPFPGPCISSRIITFSASFLCVVVLNVSFMCVSAFFSLPFIHLFIDQPTAPPPSYPKNIGR